MWLWVGNVGGGLVLGSFQVLGWEFVGGMFCQHRSKHLLAAVLRDPHRDPLTAAKGTWICRYGFSVAITRFLQSMVYSFGSKRDEIALPVLNLRISGTPQAVPRHSVPNTRLLEPALHSLTFRVYGTGYGGHVTDEREWRAQHITHTQHGNQNREFTARRPPSTPYLSSTLAHTVSVQAKPHIFGDRGNLHLC